MANIIITTHWTDGDVLPFIHLGNALLKRGHNVTLITHCYYEEKARSAGLNFTAWDTAEQYYQLVEDMKQEIDPIKNPKALGEFKEKYESISVRISEYEKIIRHCDKKHTVIVAKNRSSIAALMVAEKLGIPITSIIMAPSEILSMVTFDAIYGNTLYKDINMLRREVQLPPVESWLSWQSSPKRHIAFWPEWFARPDPAWPSEVIPVGFPLNKNDRNTTIPDELQGLLDTKKPPILITGGTSKMLRPEFYPASAKACGILGRKGILVTRYEELIPKNLPKEVYWFKELPLNRIMHLMGAVIHHGGMGTLSGSIAAGIPQLVLPYYVDRPYNAERLKEIGIAQYLPLKKWEPELIAKELRKIMEESFVERCMEFSGKMAGSCGIAKACELIEETVDNKNFLISHEKEERVCLENNKELSSLSENVEVKKRRSDVMKQLASLSYEQRQILLEKLKKSEVKKNGGFNG